MVTMIDAVAAQKDQCDISMLTKGGLRTADRQLDIEGKRIR